MSNKPKPCDKRVKFKPSTDSNNTMFKSLAKDLESHRRDKKKVKDEERIKNFIMPIVNENKQNAIV